MSRREPDAGERANRTPVEPEDALRILRNVGFGLLVASLFVDWMAHRFDQWRLRAAAMRHRVLRVEVMRPGAVLADIAREMLDATSPRT